MIVIDSLMFSIKKNHLQSSVKDYNSTVTRKLDSYTSIAETLCRNETLTSLISELKGKSVQEQLYTSYEISDTLNSLTFSSPEISKAIIITPYVNIEGLQTLYPLEKIDDKYFFNALRKNYTVLYDNYITTNSYAYDNLINTDMFIIISPITTDDISNPSYLCIVISKFYLYSEFLSDGHADNYIINSDGIILSTFDVKFLNKKPESEIILKLNENKNENQQIINYNKSNHLITLSSTNKYGWKVMSLIPVSSVTTWRLSLYCVIILLGVVIFFISWLYSSRLSKKFTHPLKILRHAIDNALPTINEDCNITEINELYRDYNKLIEDNLKMLDEIKIRQQSQTMSEMKALVSQINPHFLYNTLNVISWKALDNNCPELCTIVSKLGRLCRLNYRFKSLECRLLEEITSINLYLDLQKECFNNSFDYNIDIPEECLNLALPRFILQPIIENSIIHGFSQIPKKGMLTLTANANDNLIIKIKDNGIGINPDVLEKLNSGNFFSERYGLANVYERIKLYCGEDYCINFTSHPLSGTVVTLTLPIKPFEEE